LTKTVYILGAGFSADAGAPKQSEILDRIWELREDACNIINEGEWKYFENARNKIKKVIADVFTNDAEKPYLEDLFTILDKSLIENNTFKNYDSKALFTLRQKLVLIIAYLFEYKLRYEYNDKKLRYIKDFVAYCLTDNKQRKIPSIITTNWDILVDSEINLLTRDSKNYSLDYCCEINLLEDAYPKSNLSKPTPIKLMKLHGSMNWLICSNCSRLYYVIGRKLVLEEFFEKHYCTFCRVTNEASGILRSLVVMPTFLKDINNVHLKMIWYNASLELNKADEVVIIGYSAPLADFEIRYLLLKSIRPNTKVVIVNKETEGETISMYKKLFGNRVSVFPFAEIKNDYTPCTKEYIRYLISKLTLSKLI